MSPTSTDDRLLANLANLPVELLTLIISHFSSLSFCSDACRVSTIQSLRLTCHSLNSAASPFLITYVWASSDPFDWDRLDAVSSHPVFSQTVREVRYDDVYYDEEFVRNPGIYPDVLRSQNSVGVTTRRGLLVEGGKPLPDDDEERQPNVQVDLQPVSYAHDEVRRGYETFRRLYRIQRTMRLPHEWSDSQDSLLDDIAAQLAAGKDAEDGLPLDFYHLARALQRMPHARRLILTDARSQFNPRKRWTFARLRGWLPVAETGEWRSFSIRPSPSPTKKDAPTTDEPLRQVILDGKPWQWSSNPWEGQADGYVPRPHRGFYILTAAAAYLPPTASPPTSFEVLSASGLPLENITKHSLAPSLAARSFASLSKLSLHFGGVAMTQISRNAHLSEGRIGSLVSAAASTLTSLTLTFATTSLPRALLPTQPSLTLLLGSARMPRLRSLHLSNTGLPHAHLAAFVVAHASTLSALHVDCLANELHFRPIYQLRDPWEHCRAFVDALTPSAVLPHAHAGAGDASAWDASAADAATAPEAQQELQLQNLSLDPFCGSRYAFASADPAAIRAFLADPTGEAPRVGHDVPSVQAGFA